MACGDERTLPADNPAEFSRAPVYVQHCVSSEGLVAAADERTVGPMGLALFLGHPSRAGR